MHIKEGTLDDLMHTVLKRLLASKNHVPASKGANTELYGILLELTNPRARLSRTEQKGTIFSCLGEFLWYLSGENNLSFIQYYISDYHKYSDDGKVIYGGYGPRLFAKNGINQVNNVIHLLKKNQYSRKAVIQIFDAEDITLERNDIPCTCSLQFMIRKSRLHMLTSMRSNDAFIGLPHDFFAFTMLQELIARAVGVELGTYKHYVGSLHLYENCREKAQSFLDEGWQSTTAMPSMPAVDPWLSIIPKVLSAEKSLRLGRRRSKKSMLLPDYWLDLVRLLKIFKLSKSRGNTRVMNSIKNEMVNRDYIMYIDKKREKYKKVAEPQQIDLMRIIK